MEVKDLFLIHFDITEPRRRGSNQTPSFLQRRQVEGPGGEEDQTPLQTKNCKTLKLFDLEHTLTLIISFRKAKKKLQTLTRNSRKRILS